MFGVGIEELIFIIGFYQIGWWIYRYAYLFYHVFCGVHATPERYGKGSWAVVTGSTDGIGKAFAMHLAKQGFNIVLVARNDEKMKAVAKEIQDTHGSSIQVKSVKHDFQAQFQQKDYEATFDQIKDLDISVLVNNVGGGKPMLFEKPRPEQVSNEIKMNCYSVLLMTKNVLNIFKKRY